MFEPLFTIMVNIEHGSHDIDLQ